MLKSYLIKLDEPNTPHDYMDDLESFFYVLCELIFTRVSFNKKVAPVVKETLQGWDTKDEKSAAQSKMTFLLAPFQEELIDSDYWGVACSELVEGFHGLLQTISQEKLKITMKKSLSTHEKIVRLRGMGLNGNIDDHYDSLEALFNKTLEALETEEPELDARLKAAKAKAGIKDDDDESSAPQTPPSVGYETRGSVKRASEAVEGLETDERPTKSIRVARDIPNPLLS